MGLCSTTCHCGRHSNVRRNKGKWAQPPVSFPGECSTLVHTPPGGVRWANTRRLHPRSAQAQSSLQAWRKSPILPLSWE
jgi:hypothetical protein